MEAPPWHEIRDSETGKWVKAPSGYRIREPISWCGKKLEPYMWYFVDPTHASLAARNEDLHMICPKCSKAIQKAEGDC